MCNKGQNEKICDGQPLYEDCDNEQLWNVAAFLLCAAHAMLGLGGSLYWTCGAAYLDDNVRKNSVPVLLGKFSNKNLGKYFFATWKWTVWGGCPVPHFRQYSWAWKRE